MQDNERDHHAVPHREVIDEPPPFLGRWPNVYRFILIYLACVIGLFYAFTAAYRP